jgi:hypothetical protein
MRRAVSLRDHRGAPLRSCQPEKLLPAHFTSRDGFGNTEAARRYLALLICGEAYPSFKNGLPDYVNLRNVLAAPKKLASTLALLKNQGGCARWTA